MPTLNFLSLTSLIIEDMKKVLLFAMVTLLTACAFAQPYHHRHRHHHHNVIASR
jgi:hypothetical protein